MNGSSEEIAIAFVPRHTGHGRRGGDDMAHAGISTQCSDLGRMRGSVFIHCINYSIGG